ncbi:MAG: hypothetical protein H0V14_05840 [Chitinophagaceae bacterium]|nr:hypothetical protein [Chitinophagaceae bacterium]
MKKYLFIILIALQALGSTAQNRNDKEPFLTKSFSKESIKNVNVETSGGSIYVTGDGGSQSRVEVYIQQNNYKGNDLSKEEIQRRLNEDYQLSIDVNNNKLTAIAKPKIRNMNWKKALNISFKVFVPQNVSTELATSGGSIELKNLSGEQDFSTSGGSLSIDNLSGNIKGRTSGGSIHLANSKDEIDLQTSGGSIEAKNCTGNIKLDTSGGSLQLNALKGNIRAHTSGGNVDGNNISGELISHTSGGNIDLNDLSCSLETSTSGGNIDVSIKELGKYITINNSGGNIDLKIPKNKGVDLKLYANKIKTDALNNFTGKSDDDEISGTLNGGGIPVTVKSGSGRINLSFN